MNNLVGDVKANPRDFYRYINSQKKKIPKVSPLKKRQGSGLDQSHTGTCYRTGGNCNGLEQA